jgi:hypothetical protein
MPRYALAATFLLGLLGCVPTTAKLDLVPSDAPGVRHIAARPPEGAAPANVEIATRVAAAGQRLMAGNRVLDVAPQFTTLGVAHEELFHQGVDMIFISDGLVAKCPSDGVLTGLLALELGRAMAQRDVAGGTTVGRPMPRLLPADVAGNNDTHGAFGPADGTRMMELAKMEKAAKTPHATPEPEALARIYLRRAGYDDGDLKAAEALAQLADANGKVGTLRR